MNQGKLRELVVQVLSEHDLELEALDVTPVGKRRLVKITVDGEGPEGRGPLLDDLGEVSAALSRELDESQVTGQAPYTLEVTTRGVSAPLSEPKHFRRNRDRLVKLWLSDEEIVGRIQDCDEQRVTLSVDEDVRSFAYRDITKAVVQVEFNRQVKES